MEALHKELRQQRDMLHQLTGCELPALRMELAFLRADLQALEERFTGDADALFSADSDRDRRFARTGIDVPHMPGYSDTPLARPYGRERHFTSGFGCDASSSSDGEDPRHSRPGPAHAVEDGDTGMAVSLEPNVWDCAMMIALHGWSKGQELFGKFNVLVTGGLLIANTVIQFLFVIAVKSMMDTNPYQDEAMLNKRLQEGQLYSNLDHKTMMTKSQQTCNLQAYNMLGETVGWMSEYLVKGQSDDKHMVLPGYVICTLAMITWTVSIFSEVRRSLQDLVFVVLSLPRARQVEVQRRGGLLIIAGCPWCLKGMAVLVMVPRIIIAALLLFFGLQFLAGTIELRELLTNAVALEFVKSIDEMLFEAIMPRKLMGFIKVVKIKVFKGLLPHEAMGGKFEGGHLIHNDHESKKPDRQPWHIPVQTCYVLIRLGTICVAVLAGYFLYLAPIVGFTKQAYYELCGENTNFTYVVHPITRVPIFANLDPYMKFANDNTGSLRCFYAAQYEMLRMRAGFPRQYVKIPNDTLESLVNGSNKLCLGANTFSRRSEISCPEQSLGYFNWMAVAGENDFYTSSVYCRDQEVFLRILVDTCRHKRFASETPEDLAFFEDVGTCADFRQHCNRTKAHNMSLTWVWQMQKVCPETCGLCTHGYASRSRAARAARTDSSRRPMLDEEAIPLPLLTPEVALEPLPPTLLPPTLPPIAAAGPAPPQSIAAPGSAPQMQGLVA